MFKSQPNAWIHLVAAVIAIGLSLYFKITSIEWLFVILAIGFVFSAELFNSAIELIIDILSPEWNEKAGKVKDMAAGGVLIAAITSFIIGLIIFTPYIVGEFRSQ